MTSHSGDEVGAVETKMPSQLKVVRLRDDMGSSQLWSFGKCGSGGARVYDHTGYTAGHEFAVLLEGGIFAGHYDWYKLKESPYVGDMSQPIGGFVRQVLIGQVSVTEIEDGAVYGPDRMRELQQDG